MDCMQWGSSRPHGCRGTVSIPQAVWIACNERDADSGVEEIVFQYRKRYGLHAICHFLFYNQHGCAVSTPQAVWIACNSEEGIEKHEADAFQYRKRYGLHAITLKRIVLRADMSFNTASGMDCMQ